MRVASLRWQCFKTPVFQPRRGTRGTRIEKRNAWQVVSSTPAIVIFPQPCSNESL